MVKSSYCFRRTHLYQGSRLELFVMSFIVPYFSFQLFQISVIQDKDFGLWLNSSIQHDQSPQSFVRWEHYDHHCETNFLDRVTDIQSMHINSCPRKGSTMLGTYESSLRLQERETERRREGGWHQRWPFAKHSVQGTLLRTLHVLYILWTLEQHGLNCAGLLIYGFFTVQCCKCIFLFLRISLIFSFL